MEDGSPRAAAQGAQQASLEPVQLPPDMFDGRCREGDGTDASEQAEFLHRHWLFQ